MKLLSKIFSILLVLALLLFSNSTLFAKVAMAENVKEYTVTNQVEFYNAFEDINRDTEFTNYKIKFANDILFNNDTGFTGDSYFGMILKPNKNVTLLGNGHTATVDAQAFTFIYLGEISTLNLGDPNDIEASKLVIKTASNDKRIHSAIAFEAGTVNVYEGVTIKDIDSLSVGGAYYSIYSKYPSAVELNIYGGSIENVGCGDTNYLGGAICVSSTSDRKPKVNIKGGVIDSCYSTFRERPKHSGNTEYNDYGGAIYLNNVDFTMSGGTIQNSKADFGSAIAAFSNTNVNITGGNIINNNSKLAGGAIFTGNGVNLKISGGNISGNTSGEAGGILAIRSKVDISGGVIANNKAEGADDIYLTKGSTLKLTEPSNYGKLNSTHKNIDGWYTDGVEKLGANGETEFFLKWSKPANENMDVDKDGTDDAIKDKPFYHKVSAATVSGTLNKDLVLKAAHGESAPVEESNAPSPSVSPLPSKKAAPKSGDTSNNILLIILSIISMLAFVAVIFKKKRKYNNL